MEGTLLPLEPSIHPIKLNRIRVKSISFEGHDLSAIDLRKIPSFINVQKNIPQPQLELPIDGNQPDVVSGFYRAGAGYKEVDGIIIPDSSEPFSIEVWLYAEFSPDYTRMTWDAVKNWLLNYSDYVVYPYLRSALYTAATQAGVEAPLLPLFEVPTFKMDQASPSTP